MSDISNILSKIQKINDTKEVTLPSSGETITLKQITIKQQKDIKDLPKNITLTLVNLNKAINEIIRTNSNLTLDKINILDRNIILLVLKSQISETYDGIKLSELLNNALNIKYDIKPITSKTTNFIFDINVPSLKRDNEINKYVLKNYDTQSISIKNESELEISASKTYNNMIVSEICKFITDLKFIDKEEEISTDWNKLSIDQQIRILEEIPASEIKDIIDYIEKVRNKEIEYLTYKKPDEKGNLEDKLIEINFDFFNI